MSYESHIVVCRIQYLVIKILVIRRESGSVEQENVWLGYMSHWPPLVPEIVLRELNFLYTVVFWIDDHINSSDHS